MMQVIFPKPYRINCPHMPKALYPIHNIILYSKPIGLLSIPMIILIILSQIPLYGSNALHHMPTETAPTSETTLLNSKKSSSCSTTSNLHLLPVVTPSYTLMVLHTLPIWPMSPTGAHKPYLILLDHLLMEEPMVVWLAQMSTCWNIPNDMQTLWE